MALTFARHIETHAGVLLYVIGDEAAKTMLTAYHPPKKHHSAEQARAL
ncbi:MAG: hypothetical protein K2I05_06855 [Mailhella sp.]|nr:hypothetical protein [Mailhella sp.]